MRYLGSLENEKLGFIFHKYLESQNIENNLDESPETEEMSFQLWVLDEDDFDRASELFIEYTSNPTDPKYKYEQKFDQMPSTSEDLISESKIEEVKEKMAKRSSKKGASAIFTKIIIGICIFIFIVNYFEERRIVSDDAEPQITAIQEALLFDIPNENGPIWPGLYDIALSWPLSESAFSDSLFIKIREGEVWRFITPAILHAGLLHILFNMLWLWMLGKMIEERAGITRYLILSLIIAIITNTAQYMMSGFAFAGYSGVVCGLAGFIWMRQTMAPWEGYPLQKSTLLFLLIFVLGMTLIQMISFFLSLFDIANLPLPLANTAHVSGAITGMILARIPIFSKT